MLSNMSMNMSKEEVDAYLKNSIPLGYRFEPDDVDLVGYYLKGKVENQPLPPHKIWEVELYKYDPYTLAVKNAPSNGKWYFFTPRDRKYLNGSRPDRSAGKGYWKATGSELPIKYKRKQIGWKRTLVYYWGKQPKGEKTNWILHEFVLSDDTSPRKRTGDSNMKLDEWVLCRMYKREVKKKENNAKSKVDDEQEAEVAPTVTVETQTQTQKQEYGNVPPAAPQIGDQRLFQSQDFNHVQPQQSYYEMPFEDYNVASTSGGLPQFPESYYDPAPAPAPAPAPTIYPDDQFQFDYNFANGTTSAISTSAGGFPQFPESDYALAPAPTIPDIPQMQQETSGVGFTDEEYNLLTTTAGGFPEIPELYYNPAPAPIIPDNPQTQQETSGVGLTEEDYQLLATIFGFGNS